MADISKISTVDIANIAKIGSVDIGSISKVGNTDVVLTPAAAWASWDETSEAGLASADTFVAMMENVSAGGNETGQGGGLSGADLVLTQTGNIAGASGGSRFFDGVNDQFSFTQNALNTLLQAQTEWTVLLKVKTANPVGAAFFWQFYKLDGQLYTGTLGGATAQITFILDDTDEAVESIIPTNFLSPSTDYYIAMWTSVIDGVSRCGWSTTKPTKWSDFAANSRGQFAAVYDNYPVFDNRRYIGSNGVDQWMDFYVYYMIISQSCLMDNNS